MVYVEREAIPRTAMWEMKAECILHFWHESEAGTHSEGEEEEEGEDGQTKGE